jgi:Ca-activated chloride channel homolog
MRFWWCLLIAADGGAGEDRELAGALQHRRDGLSQQRFRGGSQLFENATSSTDRALQQRALYNLGNADFRLGQSQPKQAQQLWQRALKSYESALAIDPNDADAKFNYEFVKKKLEELKKQQQQQQQTETKPKESAGPEANQQPANQQNQQARNRTSNRSQAETTTNQQNKDQGNRTSRPAISSTSRRGNHSRSNPGTVQKQQEKAEGTTREQQAQQDKAITVGATTAGSQRPAGRHGQNAGHRDA